MRDLKIVFMGTPEFAVTVLKEILEQGYFVAGVITAPDKPAGRGRKFKESAVKAFALSKGLPVLQPTNLKSPEFIKELKGIQPNVQVVVAFRMLPKVVWQLPEYGTINLHASLLPQYRGASPINWAIINGEKITGVSTFFLDEKIDTGDMILQEEVGIDDGDTAGSLHDKLMNTGAQLVIETLELLQNNEVTPKKQITSTELNNAPKLTKDNTKIDWRAPGKKIYKFIKGLTPYPVAWSFLQNGKDLVPIKIYDADWREEEHNMEAGTLIQENKNLKVTVDSGYIYLNEVQLPGKRKMHTRDLLNGYQFEKNAKLL